MGGARHGKGNGVCKASIGVVEGRSVSYFEFWFNALRFWRESKGRRFLQTLVFASLFCFTSVAYADSGYQSGLAGVIQGPSAWYEYGASVDDPYYGYFCYAYDKYEAAVWSLGLDPTSSSFTAEVKAKLSNASTGGRFYTYASKFHTFGANSEPHAWLSRDFYGQWVTLYGRDFLYWGEVTTADQDGAKADLQTILNGGNLGGNINSSEPVTTVPLTINMRRIKGTDGIGFINIDQSIVDSLSSHWPSFYVFAYYVNGGSSGDYYVGVVNSPMSLTEVSSGWYRLNVNGRVTVYYFKSSSNNMTISNTTHDSYSTSGSIFSGNWNNILVYYSNDENNVPPTPPSNWPDSEPTLTPQPPEVPEPDTPTTEPQPDSPTPQTNPSFPVYVDVSTTTYTADLQGVLDAMNDHCIHLQNALHTQFSDFWTVLSTKMTNDFATLRQYLHGQFSWLGETVQDEFSETRDYLKELFEWLADQFDFSVSGGGYNDSTVVSWLKKIYSKLGTGTSSKPVDPVADPDQTGSWLDTLINNLLTALEDLFPGLIGQVADFFGGALGNLTQKFPFSIPWDVAAILGMLVAEPVAPSVEIPAYTLTAEGLTEVGSYDIDLSAYDAAWGAVRIMMRIAFALYVCVHTKDFLEVLERVMM